MKTIIVFFKNIFKNFNEQDVMIQEKSGKRFRVYQVNGEPEKKEYVPMLGGVKQPTGHYNNRTDVNSHTGDYVLQGL